MEIVGMEFVKMLGTGLGAVIVWWCLIYTSWFFIKKNRVFYKFVGLGLLFTLLNLPGLTSVLLAIIIYLISKNKHINNGNNWKKNVGENRIYICVMVLIIFLVIIPYTYIDRLENYDEINTLLDRQNQLLENSVDIYARFETEDDLVRLQTISYDYLLLSNEYKNASNDCMLKISILKNDYYSGILSKNEYEYRLGYLEIIKNIFDCGYQSSYNMKLAVDSYTDGNYELYFYHYNKSLKNDEMHDFYVDELNKYIGVGP